MDILLSIHRYCIWMVSLGVQEEAGAAPMTPDAQQPMTKWEQLVWERFKMATDGNRGSYNLLGIERLSAQIELLEEL